MKGVNDTLIIYDEVLLKFQGYNEGSFYILRLKDIPQFIDTDYKDLENVFSFRKNAKDTFLYAKRLYKGNYIILGQYDFLDIKRISKSIDKASRYDEVRRMFKDRDFTWNIDFSKIKVVSFRSPYITERFIEGDAIDLPLGAQVQNEYMDTYIDVTDFFKAFKVKQLYFYNNSYYLYCMVEGKTKKREFYFDLDTLKDLFRKYQHTDYAPFSEDVLRSTKNRMVVQEEQEAAPLEINEYYAKVAEQLADKTVVSKEEETEGVSLPDVNIEDSHSDDETIEPSNEEHDKTLNKEVDIA